MGLESNPRAIPLIVRVKPPPARGWDPPIPGEQGTRCRRSRRSLENSLGLHRPHAPKQPLPNLRITGLGCKPSAPSAPTQTPRQGTVHTLPSFLEAPDQAWTGDRRTGRLLRLQDGGFHVGSS